MSTKQFGVAPSKELVRNWLHKRRIDAGPPPEPDQIRHELGWATPEQRNSTEEVHEHTLGNR
ncbi:hypothetical protein [Noviherbaspirillum sp. Root189]|uniref:hypothetical protein n=1 Tax=Noviherbaspirillum sp. Root189 TaxID=1736487 RepID=UPI0012E3D3A0|nr:hypothetical protein [Noviherbaspirillum sp. Root189]